MNHSLDSAAAFLEAVSFNPAITADQRRTHIDILEGIEADMLKNLSSKGVRGLAKSRFLLWNGALLGFLMGLKAIKTAGDGALQAEGGLRDQ